MIGLPNGTRVWLACVITDLCNGFDGIAGLVRTKLVEDAFSPGPIAWRVFYCHLFDVCRSQSSLVP
jgi:hypothetical protein